MVKIALKHYIYEISIDIFFRKLMQNFNVASKPDVPVVGDFYRKASHVYGDEHYHNCTVKKVETRGDNITPYHIVYLTYEYSSGSDLEDVHYSEIFDEEDLDDDDVIELDENSTIGDLIDSEDLEFFEGDGVIALNSKYYQFYK